MDGKQRIVFLFAVFFFAGSIVLIAAQELRNRTMRQGGSGDAKKLILELRGDVLGRRGGVEVVSPEAMPTRKPGSYLVENDRQTLNSLLKRVLPSPE